MVETKTINSKTTNLPEKWWSTTFQIDTSRSFNNNVIVIDSPIDNIFVFWNPFNCIGGSPAIEGNDKYLCKKRK